MSVLKRPGWNHIVIAERVGGRDVPGFTRGATKVKDLITPGQDLHTLGRPAGATTYRDAELLFFKFLQSKGIGTDRKVFATKQVKEFADSITDEALAAANIGSIDELFADWREYLETEYGWDLGADKPADKAADKVEQQVRLIAPAADADDEIPMGDAPIGDAPPAPAAAAPVEMKDPVELLDTLGEKLIKPQNVEKTEDDRHFKSVSFMGQHPGQIVFVRLKNLPKKAEEIGSLKAVRTVADVINSPVLKPYIYQIEVEGKDSQLHSFTPKEIEGGGPLPGAPVPKPRPRFKLNLPGAPAQEQEEEVEDNEDEDEPAKVEEAIKLNLRQQSVLTEQMRRAKLQHMQRIEEKYGFR